MHHGKRTEPYPSSPGPAADGDPAQSGVVLEIHATRPVTDSDVRGDARLAIESRIRHKLLGRLSRTWIKFWEQIDQIGGGGAAGPWQRTLLLKNATVGNDIADHVTCYGPVPGVTHTIILVTGVLRKAITADLTVRINNVADGTTNEVGTFTIPSTTPVDTVVSFTSFTTSSAPDLSVFTWDVTASDASIDAAGVASFTIEWQP